jgi:phosphatidylglycerol:prolipoprotein diacylglycerol transferase
MPAYFSTFTWDPEKDFFTLPFLGHPITWYGVLFTLGFIVGYVIVRFLFRVYLLEREHPFKEASHKATLLADKITLFVVLGAVIGARLGHVFLYEWHYYSNHPSSIIKVWEGGLASHGGAVGILIALFLFAWLHKKEEFTFMALLDALCLAAAFVGGCIRIGNFINQEILGTPTTLPWGVIFLHPVDSAPLIPLHPVQLYEALGYFVIFALLLKIWNHTEKDLGRGVIAGWFLILVFAFRFAIEFIKLPQGVTDSYGPLNMGQILSLPFIALGIILLWLDHQKQKRNG